MENTALTIKPYAPMRRITDSILRSIGIAFAAILFLTAGSDGQTDQHTEGDADTGMVPEGGSDCGAKAHSPTHALCSVIACLFFVLFLSRVSCKKHRKEQAHRDPRQRRPKKIKYSIHVMYTPHSLKLLQNTLCCVHYRRRADDLLHRQSTLRLHFLLILSSLHPIILQEDPNCL